MHTECPLCGEPLEPGTSVCPLCGAPLAPDAPPEEKFPPLVREEPPPPEEEPALSPEEERAFIESLSKPVHAAPPEKPKFAFFWWYIPVLTGVFVLGIVVGALAAGVPALSARGQAPRSTVVEGASSGVSSDAAATSSQDASSAGGSVSSSVDQPDESAAPTSGDVAYEVTAKQARLYEDDQGALVCDALAEVTNTGSSDLYLKEAVFNLTTPTGDPAGSCTGPVYAGPEIIKPGERGYFYCNGSALEGTTLSGTSRAALVPEVQVEAARHPIVRYDVADMALEGQDSFLPFSVTGTVTNSTTEDDTMVRLTCILYDKDKKALAAFGTFLSDLPTGKAQPFELPGYSLSQLNVEDISTFWVYATKTQPQS